MNLIDRQAITEHIRNRIDMQDLYLPIHIIQLIDELPSIEAEPVVWCKDCINFTQGKDEWGSCFENPMKMWRETDFCSWAERKEK